MNYECDLLFEIFVRNVKLMYLCKILQKWELFSQMTTYLIKT